MFLRGLRLPVSASHTKGASEAITEPKSKGFSTNVAPIIAAAGGVVLAKKIQSKKNDSENINRNKGRKNLVRVLPEQEDETRSATENSQHEAEARKVANACKDVARLKREEEERLAAEEAARLKREEEERLATEEAARLKREEEERLAAEEAARLKREEEERLAAEEAARLKREEEERLAVEEAARLKREEEERLAVEEAAHNPEDKYLAIEDPSERAYQILIDLGMVQVTPDPDDPSYDSSKDDEYVV
jgi:Caldesmon.